MNVIEHFETLDDFRTGFRRHFPITGRHETILKFRGHGELRWKLKSTPEREWPRRFYRLDEFLEKTAIAHAEISSRFPSKYSYPREVRGAKNWQDITTSMSLNDLYAIILDLRHYGFPSLVLDWTYSPDVAAYFAYAKSNGENHVAIFVHRKSGLRAAFQSDLFIQELTPDIGCHRRHAAQQATHTMCGTFFDDELVFLSHEELLSGSRSSEDEVKKFSLSGHFRDAALLQLKRKGITQDTLFTSAERDDVAKEEFCREVAKKIFCQSAS